MEFRLDKTVLEGVLGDFPGPVRHIKVDETKWEPLWDRLVREHHYLGYDSVIGSRVKYLIALGDRVVGAISFCSAAFRLGLRDKYIGWDDATRLAMLPRLVNNNRFLILPWVRIRNLASHVLSESLKQLRIDWKEWYGVEPCMVETFVDPERFAGTCYVAANWTRLGRTKGYGRQGQGFVFHGRAKDLYVKVMSRRFASAFHPDTGRIPANEREELMAILNGTPVYLPEEVDNLRHNGLTAETVVGTFADHLELYRPFLNRKELMGHFAAMVKGLLSDMKRKSLEPIAHQYEGPGQFRALVHFMSDSPWDDQGMLERYQADFAQLVSAPGGMLTVDGSDFKKNGKMSAGVQRQYCGQRGKVENCQAGVFLGYASEKGYGLIDFDLFLPEKWLADDFAGKRKKCRIPKDAEYVTKNQMALRQIRRAFDRGLVRAKYVACDCAFGHDHKFLDALPEGLTYFADVHSNQLVFLRRPEVILPEYRGRGRRPLNPKPGEDPIAVKELAKSEDLDWTEVVLGMGSEGPFIAHEKCLRVVESRHGLPGKDVWLYIRKMANGDLKFSLCNEAMDAPVEAIRTPAIMRWTIEQSFRECKDVLGMDQYEVRSWGGWRRHMLLTLITHLFVTKIRHRFGFKVDLPLVVPYVSAPVTMADYSEAVIKMQNEEKIIHPSISEFPREKQLFTFANWAKLLSHFFPRTGDAFDEFKSNIQHSAATFNSESRAKREAILAARGSGENERA